MTNSDSTVDKVRRSGDPASIESTPAEPTPAEPNRRPFRRSLRSRVGSLVALRLLLIAATSYLLLAQENDLALSFGSTVLLATALASNLAFLWLPHSWISQTGFLAGMILVDTAWITAALLFSGHFRSEFFYIYFLVLFVAGIGDNLRLIVLGAGAIGAAYVLTAISTSGAAALWSTQTLIQIPFLVAVASFYGYLVDRARRDRRRAEEEGRAHRRQARINEALEREISERRRAQSEALKLSRAVEQSPAMVLIADPSGRVEYVNPRYCSVMGSTPEEVLGYTLGDLGLVAEEVAGPGQDPNGGLDTASEWRGESELRRGDGAELWVSISVSPILDDDGQVTHLVAVVEDMTHIKAAEETLKKANEDLKKLNQMKSDFISTVSHELRTPLTAMKNALDILATVDAASQRDNHDRFLGIASRNVERLTGLVNDILDLSRIEAGRLDYTFDEVALPAFLGDVVASLEGQAETLELDLVLDAPTDVRTVWADHRRLEQVLVNLLGNALKFTPAGGRVELRVEPREEELEISVVDTGVGLSRDDRRRIFEPFYQVDDALTRSVKGSGLGLSIARQMVQTHGGDLAVESEPGRGSRFFFSLPYASPCAREMSELELRFVEYRTYPFFGVLVVDVSAAVAALGDGAHQMVATHLDTVLPRSADKVIPQLAHRRFVLVLLGTDPQGSAVVRERLARQLGSESVDGAKPETPTPRVLGPASFPDDGNTSYQILHAILGAADEGAHRRRPAIQTQNELATYTHARQENDRQWTSPRS